MTDQTAHQPLTERQLDEIEARATSRRVALSGWINCYSPLSEQEVLEGAEAVLEEDVPVLLAEIRRLRAELEGRTEDQAVEPGALASWLHWRFGPHGQPWADVADEDKALWEHQARATRRAVERGGFKTAPVAAVVSSADGTPGSAR